MNAHQAHVGKDKEGTADAVRDVPLEKIVATLPTCVRQMVSVFRFEFRRTRTWARSSVWLMLVAFPAVIMGLFRFNHAVAAEEVWGVILYGLIPQVVCLLGLLLWVSPLLNAELEGRTWIYLAVRPRGKYVMLLGKYINGILWTGTAAFAGLTLAMLIGRPQVYDAAKLYFVLLLLVACSCCGYGAAYAALGVLFPRRAIVISVAYMLIFEVLISNIPAVINQFTIQFRLFNLLLKCMNWHIPSRSPLEPSTQPISVHLLILVLIVVFYLSISMLALRFREYATEEQQR